MIELHHYYSLTPEWQYGFAKAMGTTLTNEKITIIPKKLGNGLSYFSQIMPGISVMLLDAVFTKKLTMKRLQSDHDLYILHFDLSEEINPVTTNNEKLSDKCKFNSGFSVLHSHVQSHFKPAIDKKTYSVRLLIEKGLLKKYILKKNNTLKNIDSDILFYNHINSNSKILVNSIKEKSVFDSTFDTHLRGISLKLLCNFINTYSTPSQKINKSEIDALSKTKEYLKNNLYDQFPSIPFLSKMAGMSTTKYKVSFKKLYHITPNQYFITQKIIFANQLLKSGTFSSVTEITHLLNYSKSSIFQSKYFDHYHRYPATDFIPKQINDF